MKVVAFRKAGLIGGGLQVQKRSSSLLAAGVLGDSLGTL